MLGFGALGQFALGQAGGIRQDLVDIRTGGGYGSSRRRRYSESDADRRRRLARQRDKDWWLKREKVWNEEQERRRLIEAEAARLEQERLRLLPDSIAEIRNLARQAELARHIDALEARLQALYLQTIDDDAIAILLLEAA
jgi:hypothetical protein